MKYPLLKLIPKNLESYLVGKVSRINYPRSFSKAINTALVQLLKIDMSEAEKSLDSYHSFEDLFTRALKEGARPISGEFCAPCDSFWRHSQTLDRGKAIQAKGIYYSVHELLNGRKDEAGRASNFNPFWYSSFYLAPHHYHRVHAPFSGHLNSVKYIPGELWPVNETFVNLVPGLFCRNERVVMELTHDDGGKAFLVMVGALNVGRIKVKNVKNLETNSLSRQIRETKIKSFYFSQGHKIAIGDELGTFMLGSSVIMILDETLSKRFSLRRVSKPVPIKMGESLLSHQNH